MIRDSAEEAFQYAYQRRMAAERLRGIDDGLYVARKIRTWLTRQPDRKWQQEVRGWADNAIAEAEREIEKLSKFVKGEQ